MNRHSIRRSALGLEPLEPREVPATLVNASMVTYQDADGDTVRVTFSKAILSADNVNAVFRFDTGGVDGDNSGRQQLRAVDLTGLGKAVTGVGITTAAAPSSETGGDGFAAVGQIDASGIDLGRVVVDGDLGRIWAGDDAIATTGLKGLTALSLGRYGTNTGAPDLTTSVGGRLGFLRLKSDFAGAYVTVQGGDAGDIGPVTIGGSLIGGTTDFAGRIDATGDMGPVRIGGDVLGGGGFASASIYAAGRIAGITVGGAVRGSAGVHSGTLRAGALGAVTVGGDVAAGSGSGTGWIVSDGKLARVTVGGSLRGQSSQSGRIFSSGDMGPVTIAGDIVGGPTFEAGMVATYGKLAALRVGGSLRGGAGFGTGSVWSHGAMGPVEIAGSVIGGSGLQSGRIATSTAPAGVTIGGALIGGRSGNSGQISASGAMGPVRIGGDLVGGSASGTESVYGSGAVVARRIAGVTIGGSMIAGTDQTTGTFLDNGTIRSADDLGPVLIRGSVLGNATHPVVISARGRSTPTGTGDVAIASLTVLGRVEYARILAGVDSIGTPINADAQIGAVTVGGNWIASSIAAGANAGPNGHFGDGDDVKIAGVDVKDDAQVVSKIASLSIGGQVLGTVGGTDHFGVVAEAIGAVVIGGTPLPLSAGTGTDDIVVGLTGDLRINEL